MLKSETTPILRAISLLWRRMGRARFYVLAAAGAVILLAVVGLFHLGSVAKQSAQSARPETNSQRTAGTTAHSQKTGAAVPQRDQASSPGTPLPMAEDAIVDHPVISITEVAPQGRRGRHGETSVEIIIGVAPQPNARKGEVEIRVFFFDMTRNRELRPTEAQVAYEWLTPVRDWTDPTPKYLVATYLRPRAPRRSAEDLRYGGFIVRVYFDGKLQDQRAEPEELLAALPNSSQSRSAPSAPRSRSPTVAGTTAPTATVPEARATKTEVAPSPIAPAPTTPAILPEKRSAEEIGALPYARPVPGKPGLVYSPFDEKFLIDVRGVPPGTVVNDPHAGKSFRVP